MEKTDKAVADICFDALEIIANRLFKSNLPLTKLESEIKLDIKNAMIKIVHLY